MAVFRIAALALLLVVHPSSADHAGSQHEAFATYTPLNLVTDDVRFSIY